MLHGEIKVNGAEIGSWEARRLMPLMEGVQDYEYAASMTMDGAIVWSGVVRHRYSAGAVSLAAKIMLNALVEMSDEEDRRRSVIEEVTQ